MTNKPTGRGRMGVGESFLRSFMRSIAYALGAILVRTIFKRGGKR